MFSALLPPFSCKKLVQIDLKLKPEFEKTQLRCRPFPTPQEQVEEIERQIQECIDAGLVEEYKKADYPHHCSPCFQVAKPESTADWLLNMVRSTRKPGTTQGVFPTWKIPWSVLSNAGTRPNGQTQWFWQVDLTAAAQKLLAFVTPKGRVFKWKVIPFEVANARGLFQELMNKILYIPRHRPLVQELISRGAEMDAHIDDVSLSTNTEEDHVLLLRKFFILCQEDNLRIKLE